MTKEESNLKPTYGSFEAKGIITSIGEVENGKSKNSNKEYKKIKVTLKTDEFNTMVVDIFGMVSDKVDIIKFTGKKVEKDTELWKNRKSIREGWMLSNNQAVAIGTDINDAKTRGGLTMMVNYDAIDEIASGFKEGDSVKVIGGTSFSEYVNKKQEKVIITNYNLRKIYKIDDLDFEDEEFIPYSIFDQDVVIESVDKVKENNYLYVNAIIITNKNGSFIRQSFRIDLDKREKFAKNVEALIKKHPYTFAPLHGDIINSVILDDSVSDEEEDSDWGFDSRQKVIKGYDRAFEILSLNIDKAVKKLYTEDDFMISDDLEDDFNEHISKNDKKDYSDFGESKTIDNDEVELDDSWLDEEE